MRKDIFISLAVAVVLGFSMSSAFSEQPPKKKTSKPAVKFGDPTPGKPLVPAQENVQESISPAVGSQQDAAETQARSNESRPGLVDVNLGYRESNFGFISRRREQEGIDYFFQRDTDSEGKYNIRYNIGNKYMPYILENTDIKKRKPEDE